MGSLITPAVESSGFQLTELVRVRNPGQEVVEDIVVRQFLPVQDKCQEVDWVILADLDDRIDSVEIRPWISPEGAANRYVNWVIDGLQPGACIQVGYVCGLTLLRAGTQPGASLRDEDSSYRPRAQDHPDTSPQSWSINLSSLCQYPPLSTDWTAQDSEVPGLYPASGPEVPEDQGAAEEWDDWDDVLDTLSDHLYPSRWQAPDIQAGIEATLDGPGASLAWHMATPTRRLAAFVQAILNGRDYGGAEVEGDALTEDEAGWATSTTPGSGYWPSMLLETLEETQYLLDHLADYAFGGREGLRSAVQGHLADVDARACTCSEAVFQMLFLLRLAGVHCRELGGIPVNRELISSNRLDVAQKIGHRIIEVWDPDDQQWFAVDSTSLDIGPEISTTEFLAISRGFVGLSAPGFWGVAPRVWAADGLSLLHDGSPEANDDLSPFNRVAGGFFEFMRSMDYGDEEPVEELLDCGDCRVGVLGDRVDPGDAERLKSHMAATIAAMDEVLGVSCYPLVAMWAYPGYDLPAVENGCQELDPTTGGAPESSPPPTAHTPAFVSLVLALAGPEVGVDVGLWFTRRYLLLPDGCGSHLDMWPMARLLSEAEGGSTGIIQHDTWWGSRGRWAWDFIGTYVHLAGSSRPAGDEQAWPRFDCPEAAANKPDSASSYLSAVDPVQWAEDYGPPDPGPSTLRPVWSSRRDRVADQMASLGRDPTATFTRINDHPRDAGAGERGSYRLSVSAWGDLLPVLRPEEA